MCIRDRNPITPTHSAAESAQESDPHEEAEKTEQEEEQEGQAEEGSERRAKQVHLSAYARIIRCPGRR
eukprot:297242-Rhodomonas_salina.1